MLDSDFLKQLVMAPLVMRLDDVAVFHAKIVSAMGSKGDLAVVVLQVKPALLVVLVLVRLYVAVAVNTKVATMVAFQHHFVAVLLHYLPNRLAVHVMLRDHVFAIH